MTTEFRGWWEGMTWGHIWVVGTEEMMDSGDLRFVWDNDLAIVSAGSIRDWGLSLAQAGLSGCSCITSQPNATATCQAAPGAEVLCVPGFGPLVNGWQVLVHPQQEITLLSTENGCLPKSSRLTPLNPILKEGLLRVGGRIQRAPVSDEMKFPLILSSDSPVSFLLVKDIHEKTGHGGKDQVLSRLRERFWVIHGGSVVCRVVKSCVFCRRHFSSPLQQMMADLHQTALTLSSHLSPILASTILDPSWLSGAGAR